jgi:hypothetical protein
MDLHPNLMRDFKTYPHYTPAYPFAARPAML